MRMLIRVIVLCLLRSTLAWSRVCETCVQFDTSCSSHCYSDLVILYILGVDSTLSLILWPCCFSELVIYWSSPTSSILIVRSSASPNCVVLGVATSRKRVCVNAVFCFDSTITAVFRDTSITCCSDIRCCELEKSYCGTEADFPGFTTKNASLNGITTLL